MRELLEVLSLAVLQGVTEFLPVSSSGHLVLAQSLLGINAPGMRLEVVLHLGTMLSITVFYYKTLVDLAGGALRGCRRSWLSIGQILLSAMPAAFFYFLCHDKIDAFFESPRAIGGFLIFTGAILISLRWLQGGDGAVTAPRALLVGFAQALAVLPGVSRSGMTITAARLSGIAPAAAAEFSFLMSLPLLAGAALLDFLGITAAAETVPIQGWTLAVGALVSAAVGYFALKFLVRLLCSGRFWLFGVYCALTGLATMVCSTLW